MVLIKLQTNDDKVFTVEDKVAFVSKTIKTMIEDLGIGDDETIPLPKVDAKTMTKVLEWAKHHKDDPEPVVKADTSDKDKDPKPSEIPPWDVDFLKLDQSSLFEIILAANYLDIKDLLDYSCKSVAAMIRNKSVEEVRRHFSIVNDFAPEEEERIRRENEWCEEK